MVSSLQRHVALCHNNYVNDGNIDERYQINCDKCESHRPCWIVPVGKQLGHAHAVCAVVPGRKHRLNNNKNWHKATYNACEWYVIIKQTRKESLCRHMFDAEPTLRNRFIKFRPQKIVVNEVIKLGKRLNEDPRNWAPANRHNISSEYLWSYRIHSFTEY